MKMMIDPINPANSDLQSRNASIDRRGYRKKEYYDGETTLHHRIHIRTGHPRTHAELLDGRIVGSK